MPFFDNQTQLTQNPTNLIIKTPCTIQQINQHDSNLLSLDTTLDFPTVKRIKRLGHAAKQVFAQNAILITENTRLFMQNKRRTCQKFAENYVLGQARLITTKDIVSA